MTATSHHPQATRAAHLSVLRLIHSMSQRGGGPVECLRQFADAQASLGVETRVACLDAQPAHTTAALPEGISHLANLGPGRGSYGYAPRLVPWLVENAPKADALIIDGLWNYHAWGTWRALQKLKARGVRPPPCWVYPHGMLDPWFKRTYPLKHVKKCIYWLLAERYVLRDAAGVIFTSDEERLLAPRSFRPYHCREVVIPLGIKAPDGSPEAQRESFFQAWPALRGRRLLLYLGRLHPKKGPELAIQSFAEVLKTLPADEACQWTLVMAGPVAGTGTSPGYLGSLQALAAQHLSAPTQPNAIVFPGMLQGDLKWGALHACEAFLLPSHQENFGIAVVEALACGKPVLISKQVNIWREIQQDGAALVADDTLAGTRVLLQHWMSLPQDERLAMAGKALACFENRFEISMPAARLISAFQAVIASG